MILSMIHKNFLKLIPLYIATLVSFVPFNMIIGSKFTWFSCSSMALPALGFHASLVYVILSIFTKGLLSFHSIMLYGIHRLPLIAATRALQKRDWKVSIFLPLIAMILFCMHPVGQSVFYYSWYWFIPIIIYYFVPNNLYSRALSASFLAHAVGSVIWLYFAHVPVQAWTALMPIVPIERLLIAVGMVGFVYLFQAISCCDENKVSV